VKFIVLVYLHRVCPRSICCLKSIAFSRSCACFIWELSKTAVASYPIESGMSSHSNASSAGGKATGSSADVPSDCNVSALSLEESHFHFVFQMVGLILPEIRNDVESQYNVRTPMYESLFACQSSFAKRPPDWQQLLLHDLVTNILSRVSADESFAAEVRDVLPVFSNIKTFDFEGYVVTPARKKMKGFQGEYNHRPSFKSLKSAPIVKGDEVSKEEDLVIGSVVVLKEQDNKIAQVVSHQGEPGKRQILVQLLSQKPSKDPIPVSRDSICMANSVLFVESSFRKELDHLIQKNLRLLRKCWNIQAYTYKNVTKLSNIDAKLSNIDDLKNALKLFIPCPKSGRYLADHCTLEEPFTVLIVYKNQEMYDKCSDNVARLLRSRFCTRGHPQQMQPEPSDYVNVPHGAKRETVCHNLEESIRDSILEKLRSFDKDLVRLFKHLTSVARIKLEGLVAMGMYTFSLFANCQENCGTVAVSVPVRLELETDGAPPEISENFAKELMETTVDDVCDSMRKFSSEDGTSTGLSFVLDSWVKQRGVKFVEIIIVISNDRTTDHPPKKKGIFALRNWIQEIRDGKKIQFQTSVWTAREVDGMAHAKGFQCPTCGFTSDKHSLFSYLRLFKEHKFHHAFDLLKPFSDSYQEGLSQLPCKSSVSRESHQFYRGFSVPADELKFAKRDSKVTERVHGFDFEKSLQKVCLQPGDVIVLERDTSHSSERLTAERYAVPKDPQKWSTVFTIEEPAALDIDPFSVIPFLAPQCREYEVILPEGSELMLLRKSQNNDKRCFEYTFVHLVDLNRASVSQLSLLIFTLKGVGDGLGFRIPRYINNYRKCFPERSFFSLENFNSFLHHFGGKGIQLDESMRFTLGNTPKNKQKPGVTSESCESEHIIGDPSTLDLPLPVLWPLIQHMRMKQHKAVDSVWAGSPQRIYAGGLVAVDEKVELKILYRFRDFFSKGSNQNDRETAGVVDKWMLRHKTTPRSKVCTRITLLDRGRGESKVLPDGTLSITFEFLDKCSAKLADKLPDSKDSLFTQQQQPSMKFTTVHALPDEYEDWEDSEEYAFQLRA
jgi:hypothetical protein